MKKRRRDSVRKGRQIGPVDAGEGGSMSGEQKGEGTTRDVSSRTEIIRRQSGKSTWMA